MNIPNQIVTILERINKAINCLYLNRLKRSLKHFGTNLSIDYPFDVNSPDCIFIGDNFTARRNIKLRAFKEFNGETFSPILEIGNNVSIETDCHIGCINRISIEDNVLIASGVYISDHFHGLSDYSDIATPPIKRRLVSKGPIIIKKNVWIGERAIILPNVSIGENSIVAANAVVTKSVPENVIVAGIPARIIKNI
jgi:acetyltransferase-like isoleucine patch superfamily enzyme